MKNLDIALQTMGMDRSRPVYLSFGPKRKPGTSGHNLTSRVTLRTGEATFVEDGQKAPKIIKPKCIDTELLQTQEVTQVESRKWPTSGDPSPDSNQIPDAQGQRAMSMAEMSLKLVKREPKKVTHIGVLFGSLPSLVFLVHFPKPARLGLPTPKQWPHPSA